MSIEMTMSEPKIRELVVTAQTMGRVLESFLPQLKEAGWNVVCSFPRGQAHSAEELAKLSAESDALIIGDDDASADFFARCGKRLGLVVKWGVGTDAIDFDAASERGVLVRNTPGMFGPEVADLAMGFVLALARNITRVHNGVVGGDWPQPQGVTLAGKTIAIVGMGDIGSNLAQRCLAFGMDVLFHDPHVAHINGTLRGVGITEAFEGGDFVALTCPSTAETRGIASRPMLSRMKKGAFLVNVARGDLVNEAHLAEALRAGSLGGAALDVFEQEPLEGKSPLRTIDSVIFGAHNGSNTSEALMRASEKAVGLLLSWSAGGKV